jgi:hypothetical protein
VAGSPYGRPIPLSYARRLATWRSRAPWFSVGIGGSRAACFCPTAGAIGAVPGAELVTASVRERNSAGPGAELLLIPNLDSAPAISRSFCFARKQQCGVSAVPRPSREPG